MAVRKGSERAKQAKEVVFFNGLNVGASVMLCEIEVDAAEYVHAAVDGEVGYGVK